MDGWTFALRRVTVCGHIIRFDNWSTFRSPSFFNLVFWVLCLQFPAAPCGLRLDAKIFWDWRYVIRRMSHFYHHIPQIKSRDTVQTQINIQWYHLWFCSTARHWCLLLAHRTYGNECSTPKDVQNSSRGRLWVFKVSSTIRNLGTNPFCNAVQYFAHGSIVCHHSCSECERTNEPSVCDRLLSILWLREQACLRTIRMSSLQMSAK